MIIPLTKYSKSIIASCGEDKTIRIWDIEKGLCIKTLLGHAREINSIIYLGNYNSIFIASWY